VPGLDIYQNKTGVAYNLGFGTVTSYVPLIPGTYTLAADAASSRQTLISTRQTLSAARQYTAIVGNVGAALQQTILNDQTFPAPAGQIAMRFISQATRSGPVDVYMVPASGKLTNTVPIATGVSFSSNTGYMNVPAGTYGLAIVPAGKVPVSTTVTLLTGAQSVYASGAARTVILIDQQPLTAPGIRAIVNSDYDPLAAS
jgi:hypothetical protein